MSADRGTRDTYDEAITILFKGGRLPTWQRLSQDQQIDYSGQHVELMLSVAAEHGLSKLEGFKLIGAKEPWQRFWVIEFSTLAGAEAWIKAEMAPPYGTYGHYEYHLSRRFARGYFDPWVKEPQSLPTPLGPPDPWDIPDLDVSHDSYVVIEFAKMLPDAHQFTDQERGSSEHIELMNEVATEYRLMRLESYHLIAPQPEWHRAYIIELPTMEGAEAWINAELVPPQAAYSTKKMYLSRKWAPEFFAGWVEKEMLETV